MTDQTPTPEPSPPEAAQPEPTPDAAADATDWKAEAKKWEARSRANADAAKQLEKERNASMTESEKAVAEAEARGKSAATVEFGKRLAKSEMSAAAARRNPDYDASALDYVDLSRFIGEDGEPDVQAITAAVERLVPAHADVTPGTPKPDRTQGGSGHAGGTTSGDPAQQFASILNGLTGP